MHKETLLMNIKERHLLCLKPMLASVRMMISRLVILIEFRSEPSSDKKKSSNYRERLREVKITN